ncbi:hypothetical protein ACTXG6_18315 [Pseudonocardia sp. Cha107L01]
MPEPEAPAPPEPERGETWSSTAKMLLDRAGCCVAEAVPPVTRALFPSRP